MEGNGGGVEERVGWAENGRILRGWSESGVPAREMNISGGGSVAYRNFE